MQTMVENYLDLTIEEVYDVITNINVWPSSFTQQMNMDLPQVNQMEALQKQMKPRNRKPRQ